MTTVEEWRPWRDGTYEVSAMGRVRRAKGGKGARLGKEIRAFVATTGYPVVNLCVAGTRSVAHVHSLVAEAFIGPRPPGAVVDHVDGDKTNCNLGNLEYVTREENGRRAAALGLLPSGDRHWARRRRIGS